MPPESLSRQDLQKPCLQSAAGSAQADSDGAGEAGIFEEIMRADFRFRPRRSSSLFVDSMGCPGTDQFFGPILQEIKARLPTLRWDGDACGCAVPGQLQGDLARQETRKVLVNLISQRQPANLTVPSPRPWTSRQVGADGIYSPASVSSRLHDS